MTKAQRLDLARNALKYTSIGDAFGESFFGETNHILKCIQLREMPETTWEFTDDTVMSIAVFNQLEKFGTTDQDDLAKEFSINHENDPNRGYGATARRILREIGEGKNWRTVSKNVFDGMGSMGNGASMRVCPIGAYFFDDLERVKTEAVKSAEITHANPEGIAGAIAVAVATALATHSKVKNIAFSPTDFIEKVVAELPDSDTRSKINKSLSVPPNYHIETVKTILGNGNKMTAQDTVPFTIWCAAHHLDSFEEALWKAVSILGDRDTICAMVGGIVGMSCDIQTVPEKWTEAVEKV